MSDKNRREFLELALVAGASTTLGPASWAFAQQFAATQPATRPTTRPATQPSAVAKAERPLKLLILGGTSFLGPEIIQAALARGHTMTLFNRGKTRPHLFPDLEKLRGDRDPSKGEGLKALQGRKWDGVIDTSGYYPRTVKASAELLAPNVRQYVYISSISAYASNATPGDDETAAVGTMPDPTVETMGPNYEYYGPLKALCEQAAEAAMRGQVTSIRPGFIVGPGDWSGRFNYWPLRIKRGGEVLAPGTPDDPIQLIDVRDLAEWIVHCLEAGVVGLYNATGPEKKLSMGDLLQTCKRVLESDARFTWVSAEFLKKQNDGKGVELPIWVPPEGETAGFHCYSIVKALKAGLKFRPLEVTVRDLLAWHHDLPEDERQRVRTAGPTAEQEAQLLEVWHKERGA